ncbi:hypothetical protein GYMLUDRAFT_245792 [Collybiopsis luxurians FD-317 M1]|uniref:DUF6729 domain-containing protein n=1 Tax=Collybiopsis luxurians FD-317 M1 TaxID=944289 RepID=A0A0D0BTG2_9AGAR|nr:hypothetical protein GYMLUDRAFT_245792 [Collybiopsis luxurians FD-317 M1]
MSSNSVPEQSEHTSSASQTHGTHGGRRKGAGRKKKYLANASTPVPTHEIRSSISRSEQLEAPVEGNQPHVPAFFAQHTMQGVGQLSQSDQDSIPGPSSSSDMPLHEDTFSNEAFQRLINELNEVMDNDEYADIRIEQGRKIDESISDNGDDSMEKNTKFAEAEEKDAEVPVRSINHQYLLDFWNSIQTQIVRYGTPKCYKEGQFFVHPLHPVFALHNSITTSFSPDPLCLKSIFVWLPEYLPGRPDHYKCQCGGNLTMNGYNDNPIARRVRTSTGNDYFLFTNRYICDLRRKNDPGCGTSYQGSDPHILGQLPRWVQEAFPAYLTAQGAVDKLVIDQMKSCFAGRFGPEPFSKMLCELQTLQHSRRELMYLSAAASYGLSGSQQVPAFPAFDNPMKYAGTSPSIQYLKCIWTDYHAAVKIYMDRIQASLSGFKLAGDHTFRIMKAMARLKSEPIFSALFTVVNEWEEIRAQAMGLTKGFSILPEMFQQVSTGLKEHAHQPTSLYYCDNPSAERDFHEHITASLKENVQHIARQANHECHSQDSIPIFQLSGSIEFYNSFMNINNACDNILEAVEALSPSENLVVALSICCGPSAQSLRSIQLRTSEKILVLEVLGLSNMPASLRAILTSSHIIKIGYSIHQSLLSIATVFKIPDLTSNGPFLDLGKLAKVKGAVQDAFVSLPILIQTVLHQRLPESSQNPLSEPPELHWSNTSAVEIDSIWQIYLSLSQYNSVGLHLQPSETQSGQLVTLVIACKEVAEGIILSHNGMVDIIMDKNGSQTQLKITPAYSLVQITKVLVPGAIIWKLNQTVQWIFEHGCKAVVQTRTLRTRSAVPLLPLDPQSSSILGIPAPPPSFLTDSDSILSIGPSQGLLEHSLPVSGDEDSDVNNVESVEDDGKEDPPSLYPDEIDISFDEDLDDEAPELEPEELIINSLWEAQDMLTQAEGGSGTLASRVFDDTFHFMDRLLRMLPKKHSAFKEFAHQFSETIFVRDAQDYWTVKAVLDQKGISWDFVVRARKPWLNRHICCYIPPPDKLEADLKRLFDSFKNIVCSTDCKKGRGRFFSKDSVTVSNSLLETVHQGFLSDPPSIALYYIIGWDCDDLPLYRTIRGMNSIEGGVHMLICCIFGSLKASPELAVALLCNWILRCNQQVGHFNRTGQRWKSHFDIWLLDEITEIAIFLNILPSFCLPHILATRIATSESFGIIPIPSTLASDYGIRTLPACRIEGLPHHRDTPAHLLTRLSTKVTSPYRYLQLTQQTVFPVVPVHTHVEFTEFKRLIGLNLEKIQNGRSKFSGSHAWKGINYIEFARLWNALTDAQDPTVTDPNLRLYYKLPEQLLRHHKKVLEWQASQATMLDGANAVMVQEHLEHIRDPEQLADILPAVPLEDLSSQPDPTTGGIRGLDLTSFNAMALIEHDAEGHCYADAQFDHITDSPLSANTQSISPANSPISVPDEAPPANSVTSPPSVPATAHLQMTLSFTVSLTSATGGMNKPHSKRQQASDSDSGSRKRRKECAVCYAHECPRAAICTGKGNRENCYKGVCNHPRIGNVRIRRR